MIEMDPKSVILIRQVIRKKAIGGYPVEAMQDASLQLIKPLCNLCDRLVRQPIQLVCGHRYCGACLLTYVTSQHDHDIHIRESGEPADTTTVVCCTDNCNATCEWGEVTNVTKVIERQLGKTTFSCTNFGCDFTGAFVLYKKHYQQCPHFRIVCEFCELPCTRGTIEQHVKLCEMNPSMFAVCPHCDVQLQAALLQRHVEVDCARKPRVCIFCDCKYLESRESHEAHCKVTSGRCKFNCEVDPDTLASQHYSSMEALHHRVLLSLVSSDEPASKKVMRLPVEYMEGVLHKTWIQLELSSMATNHQTSTPLHLNKLISAVGGLSELSVEAVRAKMVQTDATIKELLLQAQHSTLLMQDLEKHLQDNNAQANELQKSIEQFSLKIGKDDIALNSLERRQMHLENSTKDGMSVWRISKFSEILKVAKKQQNYSIVSASFRTSPSGYCLRMRLFPDGYRSSGIMSLFVELCESDTDSINRWPFNRAIELALLDQRQSEDPTKAFKKQHYEKRVTPNPKDPSQAAAFARPEKRYNPGFGVRDFFPLNDLDLQQSSQGSPIYLQNDTIFIQCVCEPFDNYLDE